MRELQITDAEAVIVSLVLRTKPGEEGGFEPFVVVKLSIRCNAGACPWTVLRDPNMRYPIQRDEEMSAAEVRVAPERGEPMVFPSARLYRFALTPMPEDTLIISCQAVIQPGEKDVGRLYFLQKQTVRVTLAPEIRPNARAHSSRRSFAA